MLVSSSRYSGRGGLFSDSSSGSSSSSTSSSAFHILWSVRVLGERYGQARTKNNTTVDSFRLSHSQAYQEASIKGAVHNSMHCLANHISGKLRIILHSASHVIVIIITASGALILQLVWFACRFANSKRAGHLLWKKNWAPFTRWPAYPLFWLYELISQLLVILFLLHY